jgi:type IV pilus assembly protein PilB
MGRVRIGELLKGRGLIGDAHVITALAAQRKSGEPLGEALLGLGLIREDQLLSTLSQQCGVPAIRIGDRVVPADVLAVIPERLVRRHHVFPLMVAARTACRLLLLATSTPSDLLLLDEVAFAAGMAVVPALASRADIAQAVSRHFGEVAAAS